MARKTRSTDAPTSDRLRSDIDRGRGGDKRPFPEVAAAPLGTDAEAGGASPTPAEIRSTHAAEIGSRRDDDQPQVDRSVPTSVGASEPRPARSRGRAYLAIAVAVVAIMLAVVFFVS